MILSLFPGIDMLGHAFESELDACVVRGPDVIYGTLSDIRTFHPPPDAFDGVIGGPPCQTFSALANLVRAKGHEPRFGNLIPEFERCVAEAAPRWFLMENVPAAPVPVVEGYAVRDFVICNSWVDGGDGMGEEQERKRRFSFGVRGKQAPDLRRWIKPAALLLPKAERSVRAGSGLGPTAEWESQKRERQATITGAHQCSHRPKGGRGERRSLAEMCRLQGVPPNLLDDVPWTMQGKRQAIANGVPLPLGRAIAGAVKAAIADVEVDGA